MPNPVYARLRVGGLLYGEAPWSVGVSYLSPSGGDPFAQDPTLVVQDTLEGWVEGCSTLYSGGIMNDALAKCLGVNSRLTTFRASRVGTDGKETAVAEKILSPGKLGQGTSRMPAQSAICLSLITGRPGASYRGRLYWPALSPDIAAGRLSDPTPQAVANGAAQWLVDLGRQFDSLLTFKASPAVISTVRNTGTLVTSVRCGDRFDTQRRRAEGQEEVYSTAPLPN